MNFTQLQERLRQELVRRIDRGILTGTMLARITGYSQAHVSNFLHKKRALSLEALDRLLASQMLSAADLLPDYAHAARSPIPGESADDVVPLVPHSVALFTPYISASAAAEPLRLPSGILQQFRARRASSRRDWQRFVAIRVTDRQAAAMAPLVPAHSIALIDRHYNSLLRYEPGRLTLFAVRYGHSLLLRYLDFDAGRLVLRPYSTSHPVQLIEPAPHESPSDYITGRVCLLISEP